MRPQFSHPLAINALLRRVSELPLPERMLAWQVYRSLRTSIRRKAILGESPALADELLAAVSDRPGSYLTVALAIKLAHAYSTQALAHAGPTERAYRAVVAEALRLLRLDLRAALGMRHRPPPATWVKGDASAAPGWLAVADGSFKEGSSGAGFQLFDMHYQLRAEVGLSITAKDPVAAELQASTYALDTLRALGVRHARVLVDAQSVVHALSASLPPRHREQEQALKAAARHFDYLCVVQVPRTVTHAADRLASSWSKHSP